MKNASLYPEDKEFPLIVELNFKLLLDAIENKSDGGNSDMDKLKSQFIANPKIESLRAGLRTFEEVENHAEEISFLMETIFPSPLLNNEIKAASVPFTNLIFHKSDRFQKILDQAGDTFEFTIRNMDEDNSYIFACSLILAAYYQYRIDFKRPFYSDIPDANGRIKHYRVLFNGDFMEIEATDRALPISKEDVALLIDNFHNVDIWKEKFPPNSYIFKGFGIANLFDVTLDESISSIKTNFIHRTEKSFMNVQDNIRSLFGNDDIDLGITRFDEKTKRFSSVPDPTVKSILLGELIEASSKEAFCPYLNQEALIDHAVVAISDLSKYGKQSNLNQFYKSLNKQEYNSYICAPLLDNGEVLGLIELGSKQNQFLNSINANKLEDITPILAVVMRQAKEDHKNMLEVIIQEECTSIHPAVAWKFKEEAEKFYRARLHKKETSFQEIVFQDVFPLYGQCDIRGSSDARNLAVKNDLLTQLDQASKVIQQAKKRNNLPIYDELLYRLDNYHKKLEQGLGAGIDQEVLDFLQTDVYPVFYHLNDEDPELKRAISEYMSMLNADLKMVYKERRNYDESVMQINQHLSTYLDSRAAEAQQMFPHFFERYKTDGVEYNIYIGQSLVKDRAFNPIYLQNLKLWQLTTMCELENQFHQIQPTLATPLEIASLILAYSTSLSIRFRMDEKQFDVDGAYNARYEIVKKRIDKSYIKGTSERLTQPGKIAIVYSQQNERIEYDKYAKYLTALGYIKGEVEYHVLEDLQGITGLRAMRYSVNYSEKIAAKPISIETQKIIKVSS